MAGRGRAPQQRRDGRVHRRNGAEGVPRDVEAGCHDGVVLEEHREGAVRRRAGLGEQAAGDFLLQHDDQPAQPLAAAEELCQNRHARLVGEIGDDDQGLRQGLVVVGPRVGVHDVDVRRVRKPLLHGVDVARVDFQGVQGRRAARQGGCQDAAAGAYFQNAFTACEGGAAHDAVDHGLIAQEYLS